MDCFVPAAPVPLTCSSLRANRLHVKESISPRRTTRRYRRYRYRRYRRYRGCTTARLDSGDVEVLIIGGGLAGLSAGIRLQEAGVSFRILESSDGVGGRVRTDIVDGYTLDRGFQVFIEAYPEATKMLDYSALDLQQMLPGAVVRYDDAFHVLSDPFRAPFLAVQGLFSPVGTLVDKLTVLKLRQHVLSRTPEQLLNININDGGENAHAYLRRFGFSDDLIDKFFQPFYSGIFLAPLDQQRAQIMLYVLRMFSAGNISLPKEGIGAVSRQLAARLPHDSVMLNTKVTEISADKGSVTYTTSNGNGNGNSNSATVRPQSVIVATDGPTAASLLGIPTERSLGSTCVYFSADSSPCDELARPILALNGNGNGNGNKGGGLVNNMFIPSNVCSAFAPPGKTLISTTVVGDAASNPGSGMDVEEDVLRHMAQWFGNDVVRTWKWLKTYRIPHSQTAQSQSHLTSAISNGSSRLDSSENIFVAGDHTNTPTINGALVSGKLAAEEVLLSRISSDKYIHI